MPYTIRPPRKRSFAVGLTAVLLCLGAVPAMASASCATQSSSQIFSKFGDSAKYSLAPGGSFESGAPGWTLSHASVVGGNESYSVAGGSRSLTIEPQGSAVSPTICVSTEYPSFRLFARRASGSWGVLNVIVRWTDASGVSHETTSGSLQPGTSWTLSPVLQLGSMLPLWQPGSSLNVRLVLKPEPYGGAMAVDDVYIDPYRK
jgi:hypothetical protein